MGPINPEWSTTGLGTTIPPSHSLRDLRKEGRRPKKHKAYKSTEQPGKMGFTRENSVPVFPYESAYPEIYKGVHDKVFNGKRVWGAEKGIREDREDENGDSLKEGALSRRAARAAKDRSCSAWLSQENEGLDHLDLGYEGLEDAEGEDSSESFQAETAPDNTSSRSEHRQQDSLQVDDQESCLRRTIPSRMMVFRRMNIYPHSNVGWNAMLSSD
jgi:hypothetical protein